MEIAMLLRAWMAFVIAQVVCSEDVPVPQQAELKVSFRGAVSTARNLLDRFQYHDKQWWDRPRSDGWDREQVASVEDDWDNKFDDEGNPGDRGGDGPADEEWLDQRNDRMRWDNHHSYDHNLGWEQREEEGDEDWYNRRYDQWNQEHQEQWNQEHQEQDAWDGQYRDRWGNEQQDERWDDQVIRAATGNSIPAFAGTGYNTARKGVQVTVGYSIAAKYRVSKQGADALPVLSQAMTALGKTGGELAIEAGTYMMSGQLIMTANNTWLHGAGMDKTILKLVNRAKRFRYAGFLRGMWLRDITISDLTLDGNRQGQAKSTGDEQANYGRYGFYMDGYNNLLMARMKITNMQSYGFDPHGIKPKPWIWSNKLTIMDCVSSNNGWDGYTLDQTLGIYCANNLAEGNGRHGFNVVTGSRNILITNNRAINNGFGPRGVYKSGNGCGYVVNDDFNVDTGSTTINNNVAEKNFKAAVCLLGPRNVTITGNTFNTDGKLCAHITDKKTKAVTWSSNKCVAGGGLGTQVAKGAGGFFVGPEVDRKQLSGVDAKADFDFWG